MNYSDFDIRACAGFFEKTELEVCHDTHTGFCFSPTLCSNICFVKVHLLVIIYVSFLYSDGDEETK